MSVEISISSGSPNNLTLDEVHRRRDYLIQRGFELSETALIEALPVSGKSYGVVKWARQTGEHLTVFAQRHDLLDEYESRCNRWGLSFQRLPSFFRDCDSFDEKGNPVDHAAKELKRDYQSGRSGVELHREHSGLLCQTEGECPFVANRNFAPDEYDVLLGTYRHAYRLTWMEGRYVAFDEFPGDAYLREFEDGIAPVISAYLEDKDELPFRDYHDLLRRKDKSDVQDAIAEWKDSIRSWSYDYSHARHSPSSAAHALAPIATLAEFEMQTLDNGWGYADLQRGRIAVRNPRSDKWTFLLPPDLSSAESTVALDGTPNPTLWGFTLNEELRTFPLLNEDERKVYLRDVLGYRFIQTTPRWKAIQSGDGASPPKDLALLEGIARREGNTPALISSQKAIQQYEARGLREITDTVEHYSNLKGMNRFGTERLGVVLGNPHPGDDEIEKWAALAGESAERREDANGEKLTGNDTDYGPFGNEVMHTLVHDEVLQAAMRFGREREDEIRGATVYLHTSALPGWLPVEKQIAGIHSWLTEKNGMRDTIEAIRSLEGWEDGIWKATDLYDRTSISDRRVRDCLEDLTEEGYIEFEGKWGRGTPKHYSNICLEDAGQFGHVEFSA
ncbi:hypothetical protein [Salinilacihabitans rarus]|uniref:hypothetical protein n=1 Tax=Salinilacihabitans rarus TaxID=2961596 RepID=UPI0020C9225A|nr:hypothetical protein [Salinilacihabitans rarus]